MSKRRWTATLFVGLCMVGCRGADVDSKERTPMDSLSAHQPVYKLDNKGRVIRLKLEHKQLESEVFDAIASLTHLHGLSLYGSTLKDEDLAKLETLQVLESLGLGNTPVSDQGVKHLTKLTNLRQVYLTEGRISEAQVALLKQELPDLKVTWQKVKIKS
jgi:hypothetical protein